MGSLGKKFDICHGEGETHFKNILEKCNEDPVQ